MNFMNYDVIREELVSIVRALDSASSEIEESGLESEAENLISVANTAAKAFSGSWMGYHANVYYVNLSEPPPGAMFDPGWGLQERFSTGTTGDWGIVAPAQFQESLRKSAGIDDFEEVWEESEEMKERFIEAREGILSCLLVYTQNKDDSFMDRLRDEVTGVTCISVQSWIDVVRPKGSFMTHDHHALSQGFQTPPHILVQAQGGSIRSVIQMGEKLQRLAQRAVGHLDKYSAMMKPKNDKANRIFIGHGQSMLWRELKDFIQDRLKLEWEEFNRVPTAGVTTLSRIDEMLGTAAFAFLVMTAEDEQADAKLHPRLNVVHEAGLFQGRLGFSRAIVLLEDGCEEFSNIVGLSQIRFPKGRISAAFEEVRRVLEREKIAP